MLDKAIKAIKEDIIAEIETSELSGKWMDVDLTIKIFSGTLKGQKYKIRIDKKDLHRVFD